MNLKLPIVGVAAIFAAALSSSAMAEDLTIGTAAEPTSIDPHYHNIGTNNNFLGNIFERLVEMDERQQLHPRLAESWKAINDTTWEFKLRQDIKFQDGSEFNADDVLFSFDRLNNYEGGVTSFQAFTKGKTLAKIDDYTINITTEEPYPLMPNDVAQVMIVSDSAKGTGEPAINKGLDAKDFNDGAAAVGTGPYKLVSWSKGNELVLEKFDDYRGPVSQPWDHVTMKFIKSGPTRVAALRSGDLDFIDEVPTTDLAFLRDTSNLSIIQGPSNRIIMFQLDQFRDNSPYVTDAAGNPMDKNPLKDTRVRKALSLLLNRQAISDRVMEGLSVPAGQLVPPGYFGESPNLPVDFYSPEEAKQLLKQAGWGAGFGLTVHCPNDRYVNDAKICEAIAQSFTANGIITQVETEPKSVYFNDAKGGGEGGTPKFSFFMIGSGATTGEASSTLKGQLYTNGKTEGLGDLNRGRYSNPAFDDALLEALSTVDDEKRRGLLQKAVEIAVGEDMGVIPVHYEVYTWAARKGLTYIPRTDGATIVGEIQPAK